MILRVQTKGMTMDTLATKINDGTDIWNTDVTSRCDVLDDTYWDTDADEADDIRNVVYDQTFNSVTSNLTIGGGGAGGGTSATVGSGTSSAVCFSRGGKFYEANGEFLGPGNAIWIYIPM